MGDDRISGNQKKAGLLGMPFGTASGRLRKSILFDLAQRCGFARCYRCKESIGCVEDFSIEHKQSWEKADDPVHAFFSLENIAFSHLSCNIRAASKPNKSGLTDKERWRRNGRLNQASHSAAKKRRRARLRALGMPYN